MTTIQYSISPEIRATAPAINGDKWIAAQFFTTCVIFKGEIDDIVLHINIVSEEIIKKNIKKSDFNSGI